MQRHRIPEELTPDEEAILGDPLLDLNDEEGREAALDAFGALFDSGIASGREELADLYDKDRDSGFGL